MPEEFIAWQLHESTRHRLVKAPVERAWMDSTNQHFAYRCLPLNIANQHGWFVTCPCDFDVYWYGGPQLADLEIRFHGPREWSVSSHFGYGVLTFSMSHLFRTPPNMNLWVKGPTNLPKDGIQPLEGVVETDWAMSTFTMNWKITRPFEWISFREGEPICMLVPIPRGYLEQLQPCVKKIIDDPALNEQYLQWSQSRADFLEGLSKKDPAAIQRGWQKDYFQGKTTGGTFDGHQTRLSIQDFPPPV